ncbi:Macrolide export ATP-binding/permease protein MacB [Stieleria neptunia]|uniref:Macrolide export ATP-binding/permease protein MacB n=1 Tax=Stieleria neptunia TaxID=2527979 RepID=A0A518I480_9BACT|nr:ABC transporter permease [Stieleria neptunia]QDV47909.1 Macrolide export ATP-binding/permease protein MacB [Stieleria neptunia]
MNALLRTITTGVKSLLLQKMRAGLAALGIFIGTTTVIWLVAMGEGVSHRAQEQILELGAKNIIVRSVEPNSSQDNANSRVKKFGLLRKDHERIVATIPGIRDAIPMRETRMELRVENRSADSKLVGCSEEHLQMNQLEIARGRWLTPRDRGKKVVVLADQTATRLFRHQNPLGKSIWVGSEFYIVIGQTKPRTASAAIGGSLDARDYNLDAYIPLQTFRDRIGDRVLTRSSGQQFTGEIVELSQITVSVNDVDNVDETAAIIESLLKKFHKTEDYAVVVPKELLAQAARTRAMFNILLVIIAGISLLVGGIGIMNIMLATVTERTREIGIRRAIGAKRRDIIQQFLTETLVLTGTGGLLGVLCGLMCGPLFRGIRAAVTAISPDALPPIIYTLEPRIAPWSIGLSLFISLGTGLIFGLYPARRAAMMNPIEALRHE